MPKPNRYLEALKESGNAIGLATVGALSLATLNPLPLLVGLVAEVGYLLVIPDSKWYAARLARRFDDEIIQRRKRVKDETLPTLRPEMQDRFLRLEEMRRQIDTQSQDDKAWFREVLRKLDYLLEKFLLFASKEVQFHNYLASLRDEIRAEARAYNPGRSSWAGNDAPVGERNAKDVRRRPLRPTDNAEISSGEAGDRWTQVTVEEVQKHYTQEREHIQQALEDEQDYDTKSVLQKRVDVLQRRQEFVGKIGKILTNVNHQLQLVEDTFGLINDEIRARSPEQILADIEEVVVATETMSSTLEEIASFEQMVSRSGGS